MTCPTETHITSRAGSPTMSHWHMFGGARSAQDQCGYRAQGCPPPGKVSPGCPQKVTATHPPCLSRQLCVPHGDSSPGGHGVTSPPRRAGKRGCRAPPSGSKLCPVLAAPRDRAQCRTPNPVSPGRAARPGAPASPRGATPPGALRSPPHPRRRRIPVPAGGARGGRGSHLHGAAGGRAAAGPGPEPGPERGGGSGAALHRDINNIIWARRDIPARGQRRCPAQIAPLPPGGPGGGGRGRAARPAMQHSGPPRPPPPPAPAPAGRGAAQRPAATGGLPAGPAGPPAGSR